MKSMRWSLFTVLANGSKKGAVSWRVNKSLLNWKKSVIITGFLVNILFDSKQYYTKFASFWNVFHQSTLAFFLMLLNCPIALMARKKKLYGKLTATRWQFISISKKTKIKIYMYISWIFTKEDSLMFANQVHGLEMSWEKAEWLLKDFRRIFTLDNSSLGSS